VRPILKTNLLVLAPDTPDEAAELAGWRDRHGDHVFAVREGAAALELHDLGPRSIACREPLNVVSTSADPVLATIGNFTDAPFDLDGERYRSIESFWQGLKFDDSAERRRIAQLPGAEARDIGDAKGYGATVTYAGREIAVGCPDHWALMARACEAKFTQDAAARAALLATGDRPLEHKVRKDSRAIPGVILAAIWMNLRARLRMEGA
jgi:predicted NAD-dependent protein-ADP-ribosyltransferase YbiA (DUF1768 family)